MIVKDKVVMISGIGPGLGVKLAIHAALEGAAAVVVSARRTASLDDAEARIRAAQPDCPVAKQVNDIRNEEDCARLVEAATKEFGRVDALINNAVHHGDLDHVETAELDRWHEQFETNVLGTLRLSRAAVLQMKSQPEGGSIVMINTMGAKMVPVVPEVGYCTSKAALLYATKALALEVGQHGVRVNSLHPGWMWGTPVQEFLKTQASVWGTLEEAYERVAAQLPLGRVPTDDECARAALFLASDYASAITGASLDANGGNHMP